MKVNSVVAGEQFVTEVFPRGTPSAAPKYTINDFNGRFIASGYGAQDTTNPARWTSNIILPVDSPIGKPDQRYEIVWEYIVGSDKHIASDSFFVVDRRELRHESEERIAKERGVLEDTITIDGFAGAVNNLSVKLFNPKSDEPVYEHTNFGAGDVTWNGSEYTYRHRSAAPIAEMVAPNANYAPYLIEWEWEQGGETQSEYHFLYVVNPAALVMIHELRSLIDRSRMSFSDTPELRITDIQLLQYIHKGLLALNANPPTPTGFTISSLPDIFRSAALDFAAYTALRAIVLSEGQYAFEFGGASVNLTIDRTQYYESEIGRLQSSIDAFRSVKKMWIMRGGSSGPDGMMVNGANWSPSYNLGAYGMTIFPVFWARGLSF